MTRNTYSSIQKDIEQLYDILDKVEIDEDSTESCDHISILSDDILMVAADTGIIELIKSRTTTAPHSFEPTVWPSEVKNMDILPMTWSALYQVNWEKLALSLHKYLLDETDLPKRHDYKNGGRKENADKDADLMYPQMKTFNRIKDYVRYNRGTGIMYLVANHQPDKSGV